jgi:hypothetical protein
MMNYPFLKISLCALITTFILSCGSDLSNSDASQKDPFLIHASDITDTTTSQKKVTWAFIKNNQQFIVTIDSVLCGGLNGRYCTTVKKVDIFNLANDKKIQTIIPEQYLFESYIDSSLVVGIEDMNFDGNTDIRILNWISTNLQTTYWYWLYDETTQQFQRDSTLDEIRSPDFNAINKTIHTSYSEGYQLFGHALYKWKGNKLQLIAEETENWGLDPNAPGILTTERMINGKMKVTEREVKKKTLDYLHNGEECGLPH